MAKLRVDKIASVGVSTETTGSVFFDGGADYLSPDPGDPDLILGDTYTVEWWHYLRIKHVPRLIYTAPQN